jgi:hypothetical protein
MKLVRQICALRFPIFYMNQRRMELGPLLVNRPIDRMKP